MNNTTIFLFFVRFLSGPLPNSFLLKRDAKTITIGRWAAVNTINEINKRVVVMKWKERVALALGVSVVLLTSVLVLDIRYASSGGRAEQPDAGFILPALRHGTARQKEGKEFQRQFLDKHNPAAVVPSNNLEHPVLPTAQQQQPNANNNDDMELGVVASNATLNDDDPAAQQR